MWLLVGLTFLGFLANGFSLKLDPHNGGEKVLSKLEDILEEIGHLKLTFHQTEGKEQLKKPFLTLPNTTTDELSSLVSLLSNSSAVKLNAAVLDVITGEHSKIIENIRQIQNSISLEGIEATKDNIQHLKHLTRNITSEKTLLMSQLDSFEKDLTTIYRKIGCEGPNVNIIEGKFCHSGKWFYPIGAYIGKTEDLDSTYFIFTRLRLHGNMWTLRSAGGNVGIIQLNRNMTQGGIRNLIDTIEIADSIGMKIMLVVKPNAMSHSDLITILMAVSNMPGIFGINFSSFSRNSKPGADYILDIIANIRPSSRLLFAASPLCWSMKTCMRICKTYQCVWDEHMESTLDFAIAKYFVGEFPSGNLIGKLSQITSLPVMYQSSQILDKKSMSVGFIIDETEISSSPKSIAVLKAVNSSVAESNYERPYELIPVQHEVTTEEYPERYEADNAIAMAELYGDNYEVIPPTVKPENSERSIDQDNLRMNAIGPMHGRRIDDEWDDEPSARWPKQVYQDRFGQERFVDTIMRPEISRRTMNQGHLPVSMVTDDEWNDDPYARRPNPYQDRYAQETFVDPMISYNQDYGSPILGRRRWIAPKKNIEFLDVEPVVDNVETEAPVPSAETKDPKVKNAESLEPKVKNAESLEPKVKNAESLEPKVKNAESVEPKIKNAESEQPKLKNAESVEPTIINEETLTPTEKDAGTSKQSVVKNAEMSTSTLKNVETEAPVAEKLVQFNQNPRAFRSAETWHWEPRSKEIVR